MIRDLLGKIIRKGRIACSFVLEQRMLSISGLSYNSILAAMCSEFGCKLNTSRHNGRTYYIFALSLVTQLILLTAYLDQHPLLSLLSIWTIAIDEWLFYLFEKTSI